MEDATSFLLGSFSVSASASGCLLCASRFSVSRVWSVSPPLLPFPGSRPCVSVLALDVHVMDSGERRALLGCWPLFLPRLSPSLPEANGGMKGLHPAAPLFISSLFSVAVRFCAALSVVFIPYTHLPISEGGRWGMGSAAGIQGRRRQDLPHPARQASCLVSAPATPWPSPGPSPTCFSSERSACWACPLPRPSPTPSSCC